jgi:hypothetical protein
MRSASTQDQTQTKDLLKDWEVEGSAYTQLAVDPAAVRE